MLNETFQPYGSLYQLRECACKHNKTGAAVSECVHIADVWGNGRKGLV